MSFGVMRAVVEERLAELLNPTGQHARSSAFEAEGNAPDVVWSQTGLVTDDRVDVTYRVRLVEDGGRFLPLYCWSMCKHDEVSARCDAPLRAAHLR